MKIRATNLTAFLTGLWTFFVMSLFQRWWSTKVGTAIDSDKELFAVFFGVFLLVGVPLFFLVFGILEPRSTYVFSKEGMKSAGTKYLRVLCMLAGWAVAGLAWALAIQLLGTHP